MNGNQGIGPGRGFSILEILVAVIIIGVLALVAVPALQKRAAESRVRAAQQDCYEIKEALVRAAVDTGYYFPLHILDDVVELGAGYPAWDANLPNGSLPLERNNPDVVAGMGMIIFINPRTGLFYTDEYCEMIYEKYFPTTLPFDYNLERSADQLGFRGPYITWSRDRNEDNYQEDPWGNPYLFFTQEGMVWEDSNVSPYATTIQHEIVATWDYLTYQIAGAAAADCTVFDRATVLSLGPNGVPGSDIGTAEYLVFGKGDDIFISFN